MSMSWSIRWSQGDPLEEIIPPSLGPHPFFERYPEIKEAMEWATKVGAMKLFWRAVVTNPTAFAIVLLVPATAVTAGALSVAGVELTLGKPMAKRLSLWYTNMYNDPRAW